MRKLTSFIAALVVVFLLGACADPQGESSAPGMTASSDAPKATPQSAPADEVESAPAPAPAPEPAPEPAVPELTVSQENAAESAASYLEYSDFSRTGLIGQLEFEGFAPEDAAWAADYVGADWNAEAADSAASYLEYSSFSRQGLVDQLLFEGFTAEEAEYGVSTTGL